MELVYQLAGAGWADARITHGSKSRDMAVSYLSDGPGDMASAALQLLRGRSEASFYFLDEPGEHYWMLNRGQADSLSIRILWFTEFNDGFGSRVRDRGTEVFACDCVVLDFVGQVSFVLQNLLAEEGVEGYKRRWQNHEFPLETFTQIQRLLTPHPP